MTADLVQFLRDRLAIEEHVAKAASPGPWHINAEADEVLAVDDIVVAEGFALSGQQLRATTEHIARHDPARVLAEIEAKRRILDECAYWDDKMRQDAENPPKVPYPGLTERLEIAWPVLRLLALPYADHEAYREEWRP